MIRSRGRGLLLKEAGSLTLMCHGRPDHGSTLTNLLTREFQFLFLFLLGLPCHIAKCRKSQT